MLGGTPHSPLEALHSTPCPVACCNESLTQKKLAATTARHTPHTVMTLPSPLRSSTSRTFTACAHFVPSAADTWPSVLPARAACTGAGACCWKECTAGPVILAVTCWQQGRVCVCLFVCSFVCVEKTTRFRAACHTLLRPKPRTDCHVVEKNTHVHSTESQSESTACWVSSH